METKTISYGKYSIDLTTGKVIENATKIKKRVYDESQNGSNRKIIFDKKYVINLDSQTVSEKPKNFKIDMVETVSLPETITKVDFSKFKFNQLDITSNNIIGGFDSISEIKTALSLNDTTNIMKVCTGKRASAYGFKWVLNA
jgi:hypothetical protein